MNVDQLTDIQCSEKITELEYLAKGLENRAEQLLTLVMEPAIHERLQDERRQRIAELQRRIDRDQEDFEGGRGKIQELMTRSRALRADVAMLKQRKDIVELINLGGLLNDIHKTLGDDRVNSLMALAGFDDGRRVQKIIEANSAP